MNEGAGGEFLRSLAGKKILGINPPVYDFAWFDLWALPLGLLDALGALRERGCDVSLIDCVHEAAEGSLSYGRRKIGRERVSRPEPYKNIPRKFYRFGIGGGELREMLARRERPDAVFVTSVMTYWYVGVWEAITVARDVFPGVPITLGGVYATLCPGHAARSGADFVYRGPFPWEAAITPLDLYGAPPFAPLRASRGCPLDCDYCASGSLSGGYSARRPSDIIDGLKKALVLGARDAAIYDDALLWDREGLFYPMCALIRAECPGTNLHAPNGLQVSRLDERCCEELFETGFRTIRLSFEGSDGRTAAASSGKVSEADFERAARNLTRAGYDLNSIETYILAGLPGQTAADAARSIDFVKGLGCRPKLAEFSPIPGTRAFTEAAARNPAIISEPLLQNNTTYAQYLGGGITPSELQELKDRTRVHLDMEGLLSHCRPAR